MYDGDNFDEIIDKLAILGMLEYDYGDKYTKDGPIKGTTYNKRRQKLLGATFLFQVLLSILT